MHGDVRAQRLHGSALGPLHTAYCVCLAWGLYETCNSGTGDISDSFAFLWDHFPHLGLPCPALIWRFMPSLIATCLCYLCSISLGGLLFCKGKHWSSGSWGQVWETERRGGKGGCIIWEKVTTKILLACVPDPQWQVSWKQSNSIKYVMYYQDASISYTYFLRTLPLPPPLSALSYPFYVMENIFWTLNHVSLWPCLTAFF